MSYYKTIPNARARKRKAEEAVDRIKRLRSHQQEERNELQKVIEDYYGY